MGNDQLRKLHNGAQGTAPASQISYSKSGNLVIPGKRNPNTSSRPPSIPKEQSKLPESSSSFKQKKKSQKDVSQSNVGKTNVSVIKEEEYAKPEAKSTIVKEEPRDNVVVEEPRNNMGVSQARSNIIKDEPRSNIVEDKPRSNIVKEEPQRPAAKGSSKIMIEEPQRSVIKEPSVILKDEPQRSEIKQKRSYLEPPTKSEKNVVVSQSSIKLIETSMVKSELMISALKVQGFEGDQFKGRKVKKFNIEAKIPEKDLIKESNYFDESHGDLNLKPKVEKKFADFSVGQIEQINTFPVRTYLFDRALNDRLTA